MAALRSAKDPLKIGMMLLTERGESVHLPYEPQTNRLHERT